MAKTEFCKKHPIEFRILRRDLAAVNSLLSRGLIGLKGSQVIVLDAGKTILAEHKKAVSNSRAAAGRIGGPEAAKARVAATTEQQRTRIARHAANVRHGGDK